MTPAKTEQFKPATPAELDELAAVSPSDVERAKVAWRQDASPEFRELLDAEPEPDEA